MTKTLLPLFLASATFLTACGGGGGDAPAAPSTDPNTTFPLAAAYRSDAQKARNDSFTISGTCGGTATQTIAAAVSATTFEAAPAFSQVVTQQINLTGCTPATASSTSTNYLDQTTYMPRGTVTPATEYGVVASNFGVLPATVKLGDAATVGLINLWSNSTKATSTGTRTLSYSVAADTTTTIKVTVQSVDRNTANAVLATRQSVYRLDTSGNLTLLLQDVVFSNGTHMVLTKT